MTQQLDEVTVTPLVFKRQATSNEHKTRVRSEHGSVYLLIPRDLAKRLKLALNSELVLEVSTLPFYEWELKIRVPREKTKKEEEFDALMEKLIEDVERMQKERMQKEKGNKDGWVEPQKRESVDKG